MGGVGDYSYQVASRIAENGRSVHVWGPKLEGKPREATGVIYHDGLGKFTPLDLNRVDKELDVFKNSRLLLVQWVPHGYGFKSLNLLFCLWIWKRARINGDRIDIMVHEPFLAFGEGSWRQDLAALIHRLMAAILLNAAKRVWVAIPEWERNLTPYALGRKIPFVWLPVPSNISFVEDPVGVLEVRKRYAPQSGYLIGSFGTYGKSISELLMRFIPSLLSKHGDWNFILLGNHGEEFHSELLRKEPKMRDQVCSTGFLREQDLSKHIQACDLFVQPYPDGVSSRRCSTMALLSHSRPVVTTLGRLTEPLWLEGESVVLVPPGDIDSLIKATEQLLNERNNRDRLGERAKQFYIKHFDITETVSVLAGNESKRIYERPHF